MPTDLEYEQLEQEEHGLTEEALAIMLAMLIVLQDDFEKELRSLYQKYGKDGVITNADLNKWVSEEDHTRRRTVLTLFISNKFDELYNNLTPEFKQFLTLVIDNEMDFFNVQVDDYKVLNTPWGSDDATWETRLADDVNLWKYMVLLDLKRSFHRKEHIDKVLERLDKRFSSMENVLEALAISETTAIGSIARRQIFNELGVKKYRFYARADERTCDECGSLHGLVFPISAYEVGVTAPCLHPRCRCTTIPIIE